MKSALLREKIEIRGINPFIKVGQENATLLKPGWRKPLPVLFRLNGQPSASMLRTNMMPAGDGSFYLYLNGDARSVAGVTVGDIVEVQLKFDADYRGGPQHAIPARFSEGLKHDPVASSNWNALTPSRRKEILRYFAALKSAEALQRNVERALRVLSGQSERFMARNWTNGS